MKPVALAAACLAALAAPDADGGPLRFEFSEAHMGSEFRVVLFAPDEAAARVVADSAFAVAARYEALFSDYRDDSAIAEVARLAGSGEWYNHPDADFLDVVMEAKHFAEASGGVFDPTVGPLTRLWRWSARRGELPDSARLAEARALVGHEKMEISSFGVRLTQPGMSLDLGGIAKGAATDAMLAEIVETGCVDTAARAWCFRALVDAGGDVKAGQAPPDERGWSVVTPFGDTLTLEHTAVATSGDTFRFVEVDGVRYSHILDPRTGVGVVGAEPVTVVSRFGFIADALASACSVLDREACDALLRQYRRDVRRIAPGRRRSY